MKPLPTEFFAADAVSVARDLLGRQLLSVVDGETTGGVIIETEAYVGEQDTACHASRGCTPRTQVMYGPPGRYYVYLIYGMYHMLNIVTASEGTPEAVLIRALHPQQGKAVMCARRGGQCGQNLTNGPGKLCQALAVDKRFNSLPVTHPELYLLPGEPPDPVCILSTPRIGIGYASEADQRKLWRFLLRSSRGQ